MLSLPYISLDLLINFFKVFSLAVIILLYHLKFLNIAISANKNLLCRHIKSISYLLQKIFMKIITTV